VPFSQVRSHEPLGPEEANVVADGRAPRFTRKADSSDAVSLPARTGRAGEANGTRWVHPTGDQGSATGTTGHDRFNKPQVNILMRPRAGGTSAGGTGG
jgi:hypothetical protein